MKKTIKTEKAPKAIGPYSQAVEINGILFISGQIPLEPAGGKLVGNDIKSQTHQVLKNIEAILNEAGYSFENIVKTRCMLADLNHFQEMNMIYAEYFPSNPPARAAFEVAGLPLGSLIEIEAMAIK